MFSTKNLQLNRGVATANAQGSGITTVVHTYKDETLTVGAIELLFPDYLDQGVDQEVLFVGDHILILGSDTTSLNKIDSLAPFTIGIDLFSGASGLTIAAPIAAVDANAAKITGQILQMEAADATYPGIVTIAAQTFAGLKSFDTGLKTDLITEVTASNGTAINGTNIKGNKITFADTNVFWDNAVSLANTTRFSFDATDYISYDKVANAYSFFIGGISVAVINSSGIVVPGTNYTAAAPIAATDANAIIIDNTLSTIKLELADATHPGIISIAAQTLAGAKTFTGGVLSNSLDAATAVPLVLGGTTATAITLSQDTTVSNTKVLKANTLDATTAGTLAIGTTTATAITLAQTATLPTGKSLLTNTITETTASNGTTINGNSVKSNQITMTNTAVFWDTEISAGFTRLAFDANDYIAYNKALNTYLILIGGVTVAGINSTSGFQTDVGVDRITAGTLSIGAVTATAISIGQNTTLAAGKILHADIIDATTAGTLSIAPTTATAITLAKSATVTAGQLFKANSIDSATAVPLVLAPTTGTAITLSQDTTVTSGKLFKATSIDASTATALILAPTTATSITLSKNVTASASISVAAGFVSSSNFFDATTAGAMNLGQTTATSITLSKNTNMLSGTTLTTNFINEVTASAGTAINSNILKTNNIQLGAFCYWDNAVVVANTVSFVFDAGDYISYNKSTNVLNSWIGGTSYLELTATNYKITPLAMLTSNGLQFSQTSSDPNQSVIKDYVEDTLVTTFTNNTLTTGSTTAVIRRIGKLVTILFPSALTVASQATPLTFISNTALPTKYRTINAHYAVLRVLNSGANSFGMVSINGDGTFTVYSSPTGASFATGATIGFDPFCVTYPVA